MTKEIDIKSSTVDKGLEIAKDFLQSVMKPSLDEVGELFADKVKVWRLHNQIKSFEKVRKIVEKENVKTRDINMKVLFPYLEGVAIEDDETLQDMWANLFVNYIDSDKSLTLTVYPEILKQLSSNEANSLKYIYDTFRQNQFNAKVVSITPSEFSNLERLGLIQSEIEYYMHEIETGLGHSKPGKIFPDYTDEWFLTNFGFDFVEACTRDNVPNK